MVLISWSMWVVTEYRGLGWLPMIDMLALYAGNLSPSAGFFRVYVSLSRSNITNYSRCLRCIFHQTTTSSPHCRDASSNLVRIDSIQTLGNKPCMNNGRHWRKNPCYRSRDEPPKVNAILVRRVVDQTEWRERAVDEMTYALADCLP